MPAYVLVICCEASPQLLRACGPARAGLSESGAASALRVLPGAAGQDPRAGTARPAPAVLDTDELTTAQGVIFATAGAHAHLASTAAEFLATTAPLWARGQLRDRIVSGFTTADGPAGEESLAGLLRAACHWGSVLLPGPRPGAAAPRDLHALGARTGRLAARAQSPALAGDRA